MVICLTGCTSAQAWSSAEFLLKLRAPEPRGSGRPRAGKALIHFLPSSLPLKSSRAPCSPGNDLHFEEQRVTE